MHSFLRNTAKEILETGVDLQKQTIVLPNRRAGLFFTQHLGNLISEPTWMPEVKTIEDIFYELAGNRPADDLTLIFELYRVYQDLNPEAETFDRFYFWGEMILKDFNDVDQFMADASKLYHHLSEIKELESDLSFLNESQVELIKQFWSSFERQDRGHQEKFLKFWKLLSPLYTSFQASLAVSGLAYSGMLYRKVIESIGDAPKPEKQVHFIGFNAFTGTEEALIKHYITEFEAKIYWDVDAYYLDDKVQEAGLFFRDYQKDKVFGPTFPEEIPTQIEDRKASIKTYATPLKTNQANLVGAILEKIPKGEAWEETVVILPDEQMLFPVLHTLPEQVDKVNVTMGYPVKNAPVYSFLEAVLEMQRFIKEEDGKVLFYHTAVKNLLSSTYLKSVNPHFAEKILEDMQLLNQIHVSAEKLHQGGDLYQLIFQKLQNDSLFSYLGGVMEALAGRLQTEPMQRSYLYQCFKQLTRLKEIFAGQDILSINREFFIRLFRQIFREVKLPFEGEPLQGLQVMGVLESRNLDFKRVIICNMNEDSFPPSAGLNSMIPFNIRKAFNLPVQEQNDSIYAYTFYRLLHSAEEVHMIYTTASDQGKAGEKSRYIQQMAVELGRELQEEVLFIPIDQKSPEEINIVKTAEVLELLDKYLVDENGFSQTSFSPSALSVFLDCRLKFYLQYLANIQEKQEVSEEIDAAVFGNLAHLSMEILYQDFAKRKGRSLLEKEDFEELSKSWVFPAIEKAIRQFYHLEGEADTKLNGQMAIARDVLQKYLKQILKIDEASAPFKLISLEKEKKYKASMEISTAKGAQSVSLKGIIDRVDEHNSSVRLIDYKSGQDNKAFPDIPSLFDRENKSRNKAAMQTMFYGLIYQATNPENTLPLKPAIFNLREMFEADFNPYLQQKLGKKPGVEVQDYRQFEEGYSKGLRELLEDIYNPDIPFSQTDDLKKCEYCPYKEICGR
ncbi:PD-(D/E)XK nuclease family protein [Algoriphagus halophytocola]|uniref:PD-(D/E)XK nuclease family protein n=1 Tax=Algoriphagus halophytocola TaxID=2991499 RepID=A0ABY6MJZ7_9BACT|nr:MULTISPECIES: PD-(D/E)XK nuclease family protein [unclassified Algoriphagus]UZD24110.1 PD-(D/E)XK nuclease family protein [Algoriphagus sp. TR-M5]WBL41481.1 PD-(D/E)XK nuclease family protein [Algoriphagus sp. TR-M9]